MGTKAHFLAVFLILVSAIVLLDISRTTSYLTSKCELPLVSQEWLVMNTVYQQVRTLSRSSVDKRFRAEPLTED